MANGILGLEGFETDYNGTMWEVLADDDIVPESARSGGRGLKLNGFFDEAESWLWEPINHVILGFAWRHFGGTSSSGAVIAAFQHPGSGRQVYLSLNSQNSLEIYVYGAGRKDIGNRIMESGSWHYLEFRYKASDTVGEIEVRVNGDPTPELYFAGDTVASGLTPFTNQFHFGEDVNRHFEYDDVYVRDNTTGLGFLGDVEVIGYGLQDDFAIEWGRNQGAKNYENVDETRPDEDTTHVTTDIAARDLYVVGDTAYQGEILAVQLVSRARKTTTHLWRYRNTMQVSGVNAYGPWRYLGFPAYATLPPDVFPNAPNGNPWSIATFNAMVVGPQTEPMDVTP